MNDNANQNDIMVSIRCLVYNHEPYLRQCLDGFVMQKTNFKFEAIVHDDASTDGSAAIIKEYAEKYPDIIKPIFETENQYSKHDGSLSRIMNAAMRGKYIAFCEGDDYWTDPLKLQKQVDAMEQHPECSICTHNVQIIRENGEIIEKALIPGSKFKNGVISQEQYALHLLSKAACTFQLSSYFIKTKFLKEYSLNPPDYFKYASVGDEKTQRYCLNKGSLFFIDDTMSCYRSNSIGSWTQRLFSTPEKKIKHCEEMIKMDMAFDKFSENKFHSFIEEGIRYRKFRLLIETENYGKIFQKENATYVKELLFFQRIRYRIYKSFPFMRILVKKFINK